MSDRKSYNQICPVTTALDYVGDRWTILIIRELLGGAARFNEIRDGLPGIASNLLTERLRRLEEDGLVRQIKTHNTVMYALTESGEDIRTTLEELGMWGARMARVAPALYGRSIRAIAMALQSIVVRAGDLLPVERIVIELNVDGEFVEVVLSQAPTVTVRPPGISDASIQTTHTNISAVLIGQKLDDPPFTHMAGDESATQLLYNILT